MKFKTLHIKNIASVSEAEIDFSSPELKNESLFLICGETGAGKTTILDAICLALYKNTPRLEQSNNEKYRDELLKVNEKGDNVGIQVKDPRQYLKRGEKKGYVSLLFEGNDGKEYEASLSFEIGRTSNLKAPEWLLCERGGAIYDKEREIRAKIEEAAGFDFDQFCRTSMLAQGEFTRFLKSNEKEKSDILEKLTGTGIYSAIGSAIFERYRAEKQKYESLSAYLSQLQMLTPEQEEELRERMKELQSQSVKLASQQKQYENAVKWWQDRTRFEREKEEALARAELLMEKWEKFAEERQDLSEWRNSESERNLYLQIINLEKDVQLIKKDKEKLYIDFLVLTADECYHKSLMRQKEQQVSQLAEWLDGRSAFAPMYEESAVLLIQLEQYENALKEQKGYLQTAARMEMESDHLQRLSAEINADWTAQKGVVEEKELQIGKLQSQLKNLNRPGLQQEIEKKERELKLVTDAETRYGLYVQMVEDLAATGHEVSRIQQAMDRLANEETLLKRLCVEADEQAGNAKSVYDKMQLSVGEYAKHLRAHLQKGDVCPVCGQRVGDLPHDSSYESALKPVRELLQSAEAKALEAHTRLSGCQTQREVQSDALGLALSQQRQKSLQLNERQQQAEELLLQLHLPVGQEDVLASLSQLKEVAAKQLQLLREKWHAAEELQERLNVMNEEKEGLVKQLTERERRFSEMEKKLVEQKTAIRHKQEAALACGELADNLLQTLSFKISYPDWTADLAAVSVRLKEESELYQYRKQQKRELEQFCVLKKQEQEQAREWCRLIMLTYPEWKASSEARPKAEAHCTWSDLSTRVSAFREKEKQHENQLSVAREALDSYLSGQGAIPLHRLKFLAGLDALEMDRLGKMLSLVESELNQAKGAVRQAEGVLQNHLQHKVEMPETYDDDGVVINHILSDKPMLEQLQAVVEELARTMADLQRKIGGIRQQLEQQEKISLLIEEKQREIRDCGEEFARWEELCEIFGDREGKKFRVLVQGFVMKELLVNANIYLHQFSDRYELFCEERLTILVKDAYYGGIRRPLNMVSGGESFVVSLALALGLSALNQNASSADILFIDEGFGSLSSDYLEVVMSTLDRLKGSRRVGIISHVEALRERIPVKILVEKTSHSSSKISIVSQ